MTSADGGSREDGGPKADEGILPGISKENTDDTSSVNMQKSGDDKPAKSKEGVDSSVSLNPASSPSTSEQNNINIPNEDDETSRVLQKLGKLNIRGDCDSDSDAESESGLSSCESSSESDSEDNSEQDSPTLPRRVPTLRKRGPNGVLHQFGPNVTSHAVSNYSETNQRYGLLYSKTSSQASPPQASPESGCDTSESQPASLLPHFSRSSSEDILASPGQILEDEGKIRGFLQTPPNSALPVLDPDDLTCLSGSSPEHVSTSDYGSLPGSPYETPAALASPLPVSAGRTYVPNQTPDPRTPVDLTRPDFHSGPIQERLSFVKLRKMRDMIVANPSNEKFLLLNENGNSQLTQCLAQMAHKVKDYDEHLICAMIDFCAERKSKLLSHRNIDGETPLLIACGLRSHAVIARHLTEALIRLGHHFQERYDGPHGNSLLHAMALRGERCYPCMREILELHSHQAIPGFDINALNTNGLSPLHLAVLNKNPSTKIILLLIRYGAEPCLPTANPDYNGNAIHLALRWSMIPAHIVELLLSQAHTHCADLLRGVGPDNQTPIQMAEKRKDLSDTELTRLIHTLQRWGADGSYSLAYDMVRSERRKVDQEIIGHFYGQ